MSDRLSLDKALERSMEMLKQGAAIIDIGGESTRPGVSPVSLQQEMDRVLPVVEQLAAELECVISVDTSRPQVMEAAVGLGAGLINDVRALRFDGALEKAVTLDVPVCLMHMQASPDVMQDSPSYENVVDDVIGFLLGRVEEAEKAGIKPNKIMLDPGFGFGKTLQHNLQLLQSLEKFVALGKPVLVGMSRKSMLGDILHKSVEQRVYGGVAATTIAALKGASIIRTHDVAATCDALKVVQALGAVCKH